MQFLQAPAIGDEAMGQPVEQLGMRRLLAQLAEVARGGHQPAAEMILPDAVDDDARGERIVRLREPAGQRRAAARGVGEIGGDLGRASRRAP